MRSGGPLAAADLSATVDDGEGVAVEEDTGPTEDASSDGGEDGRREEDAAVECLRTLRCGAPRVVQY